MSVLTDFAMFPTDKGISVSQYVSKIIKMIHESGFTYKLTSMGTIIETDTLKEALELIQKAYDELEPFSERIYVTANFDIQKNKQNRITGKVESIENKIGKVKK
ncbi:MAG: MTH1187 family thiamine-binding protein [Chlorobi bacterium]|nr:MTH1187 family thiamine-binding protein [Chlorobiota bacterium]